MNHFLRSILTAISVLVAVSLAGCQSSQSGDAAPQASGGIKVLAVESFLADIAQNVAGDRMKIDTLMPVGLDPHAFEPTPQDIARIADSNVLIANGTGYEEWLQKVLDNAGGARLLLEASKGLASRQAREGEAAMDAEGHEEHHDLGDPHFWLDPTKTVTYVENIRDGLMQADPENKAIYEANAADYIAKLQELDTWIQAQVDTIPVDRRLLVTNHESLGYYADRYGFKIIGSVIPSVSSNASPSAQQLTRLTDAIRGAGAPAIFLEMGSNPQLAQQLAAETGIKIVADLYTESLTPADGNAPTYLDMMRYNTQQIVNALK